MTKRRARYGALFGLLWAALAFIAAGEARAGKLIGVVFDDSGSMKPSYNLPLLGLQMLASTLDGRPGEDRLLVTRFGWHHGSVDARRGSLIAHNVHETPLSPQAELQATIADFRNWRISPSTGTPYEPLDLMLEALVQQARSGQEVHFVVISDGEFTTGLKPPAQLRARYLDIRQRLSEKGARLQAHFLLILNASDPGTVAEKVRQQRVRAELLLAFNGGEDAGSYIVDSFDRLREAMIDIIARVSETDPRRSSSVVLRAGQEIVMQLPFAVSRVITLSTGRAGAALPRPKELRVGFGQQVGVTRVDALGDMREADLLPAWQTQGQWAFAGTQFIPSTPLQPGRHIIPFDGQTNDVTMLFRTDVSVGWKLIDGDRELSPSASTDPMVVEAGREMTLDVFVNDRLNGNRIVNLAEMPRDARFVGRLVAPNGEARDIPLRFDPANARVRGPVRFSEPGKNLIEVKMLVAGAPSTSSGMVAVDVVPRMNFSISVEPSTGGLGNRFSVETTAGSPTGDPRIAKITVSVDAGPRSGDARVSFRDLPPGVEAVHAGAPMPAAGKDVAFQNRAPFVVELRRTPAWTGVGGGVPISARIGITVEARGRARGTLEATVELVARVLPARLINRGYAGDRTGATPLIIGIAEFGREEKSLDLAVSSALEMPSPEDFKVTMPGWLGAVVTVGAPGPDGAVPVRMTPNAGGCFSCSLYIFGQKRYEARVAFLPRHGLQNAAETVTFELDDTGGGGWYACLWFGIVLFGIFYAIIVLIFLLTAYRFPRAAVVAVETRGDFEPRIVALNQHNWIGTFGRASPGPLRFLLGRNNRRIREKRRIESLRIMAEPGGVTILPSDRFWPEFTYDLMGAPLGEISPIIDGQEVRPISLPWGAHLVDYQTRRVLGFWERRGDVQTRMDRFFKS